MSEGQDTTVARLEIHADVDRRAAEALALEIRRLARRHGVALKTVRVETASEDADAL
jgi:hypothetical protein